MIEFPPPRIARVRVWLALADGDARFELPLHFVDDSYRIGLALVDVARAVGALAYLFTGEPPHFDRLIVSEGKTVVRDVLRQGRLRDLAMATLRLQPTDAEKGVTWETDLAAAIGTRTLFLAIVDAFTLPYVEQGDRDDRSYAQRLTVLTARHIEWHAITSRIEAGARFWDEWQRPPVAPQPPAPPAPRYVR